MAYQRIANGWLFSLGLVITALWMAQACAAEPASLTAAEHLQAAHDGRAVWKNFPGFEATIIANDNGRVVEGRLIADALGTIKLEWPQSSNVDSAWIDRALDSVIGHRLSDNPVATNVEFADENVHHPLGRLIRSRDPREKSLWRVKGDVLTEVHRINDKTHLLISVADVARNAEGRHLPQNFAVETWNVADGRLIKSRQVHTEWTRVGEFDLPTSWWAVVNVDGESRTVHQLVFKNHRLLTKTAQK